MDFQQIVNVISSIPSQKLLDIAEDIKKRMKTDPSLIEMKDKKEYVTQADIQIQLFILKYMQDSKLRGTYKIKAEEELTKGEMNLNNADWQLIIDSLDGTSAFCKGQETWGVMVGACDPGGVLQYSWNLVSSGDVYANDDAEVLISFKKKVERGETLAIDVYDYGAGSSEKFGGVFEKLSGLSSNQYIQTSYPAAVWAGWELFNKKLNGLLWLPSKKGKKYYPDYDLIFLGALQSKGYSIRLAKIENSNAMISIAPTEEDLDLLWKTGLELVPEEQKQQLEIVPNPLKITSNVVEDDSNN